MKKLSRAKYLWVILISGVILGLGINMLPPDRAIAIAMEHGPIEMVTEWGLLIVVCLLLIAAVFNRVPHGILAAMLIFPLYLRELDFNSRFTTMGVFKTRFYISPEVPIGEKLIVFIIMIMLLLVIGRYLFFNLRSFIKALQAGKPYAFAIALAVGMAILSKGIETATPLREFASILYCKPPVASEVFEEVFELYIPIYLACGLYFYLSQAKQINTN